MWVASRRFVRSFPVGGFLRGARRPRFTMFVSLVAAVGAGCVGAISGPGEPAREPDVITAHEAASGQGLLPRAADVSFVDITSPADGARLRERKVVVRGIADVPRGGTLLVNGLSPARHGREFIIELEPGDGPLLITATAGTASDSINVEVDATPPRVILTSPATGTFLRGGHVRITGRVEERSLASLKVDGRDVNVNPETGRFEITLAKSPGAYRVRAEAHDELGNFGSDYTSFLIGDYRPTSNVPYGASVQVGTAALAEISRGASELLRREDLDARARALNPVLDEWWATVTVDRVTRRDVAITLRPDLGYLEATVEVPGLDVAFTIDTLGDYAGRVTTNARVSLRLYVTAAGSRPIVTASEPVVALDDFMFMIDYIPGFVENAGFVRNKIRSLIESTVRDAITQRLPPFIEDALSTIPMSAEFTALGANMHAEGGVADLIATPQGIRALLDLGVGVMVPGDRGFRTSPGPLMLDGALTPPVIATTGIGASLSFDFLNAVLHEAWRGGLGERRIDPRSVLPEGAETVRVRDLVRAFPSLDPGLPGDTPVVFAVEVVLPPVVRAANSAIEISLPDVRLNAIAPVEGVDTILVAASIGLRAPISMRITGGAASIELGMISIELDGVGPFAGHPTLEHADVAFTALAARLAPRLVSLDAIPLPTAFGFRVTDGFARAEGPFFVAAGDIAYASAP